MLNKKLNWSLIFFLSIEIVKTSMLYFLIFKLSKLKSGISFLHGTHQVAQKLITYPFFIEFFGNSKINGFPLLFKIAKFGNDMLKLSFLFNNGGSDLNHFFDKDMSIFKALKLRGIPTTVLLNKQGLVISKHEGILKWGEDKVVKNVIKLLN